jgi:hypothetical protein
MTADRRVRRDLGSVIGSFCTMVMLPITKLSLLSFDMVSPLGW